MSDIKRYDIDWCSVIRGDGEFVRYDDVAPLLAELERLRALKAYLLDELSDCMDSGCDSVQAIELADVMVELKIIRKVPYDPNKHGKHLMNDVECGDEIYYWGER